ncbi:hypothetical protein ABIA16_003594 [Sinorhizobium fredii]
MKALLGCLLFAVFLTGCDGSENGKDEFSYLNFDTSRSVEENLKNLNEVQEGKSPKFERLVSGREPGTGGSVLIGVKSGRIAMMSIQRPDQYIGATDLKSLADLEKELHLPTDTRVIKQECQFKVDGVECVEIFYLCQSDQPSYDTCAVNVTSMKGGSKRSMRVGWRRNSE